MSFLNPDVRQQKLLRKKNKLNQFQEIIYVGKIDIETEWKNLCDTFSELEIIRLKSLEVNDMWLEIYSKQRFDGALMFPNLSQLVTQL